MGLIDLLRRMLFGKGAASQGEPPAGEPRDTQPGGHLDVAELAHRLDVPVAELEAIRPAYREFTIPKRSGSQRKIEAPLADLKRVQRRILRRVLGRLASHPTATGFERGHSIVTHALVHTRQAVVLRMDLRDFFQTTWAKRVEAMFRGIGWDARAARLLTNLCTHKGRLPQGAPTSPRLSNLVNRRMDARLAGLAHSRAASYSRYADDITFSLPTDDRESIAAIIGGTKRIVAQEGPYELHQGRKLQIRRRHGRQVVTGLVVNEKVALPRRTRRWLRAVEHHLATGREATITPRQLQGWRALAHMVRTQSQGGDQTQAQAGQG